MMRNMKVEEKNPAFQSSAPQAYAYDAAGISSEIGTFLQFHTSMTSITTHVRYDMGEQFDPDLGLYFLRARYMDTDRGRFWTMDPQEGWSGMPMSLHRYLYAGCNPIGNIDPTGQSLVEEVLVGFLVYLWDEIYKHTFKNWVERSRANIAAIQINELCSAVRIYMADNGRFPSFTQGLQALVAKPSTPPIPPNWHGYLNHKHVPKDPWGNDYIYSSNLKGDLFYIMSRGEDGVRGTADDVVSLK